MTREAMKTDVEQVIANIEEFAGTITGKVPGTFRYLATHRLVMREAKSFIEGPHWGKLQIDDAVLSEVVTEALKG